MMHPLATHAGRRREDVVGAVLHMHFFSDICPCEMETKARQMAEQAVCGSLAGGLTCLAEEAGSA